MLNVFWGVRASTASYLWADALSFPCAEQTLFPWSGLPHSWGMDFWGVCGEEELCQRKQKTPCAAETFSLFLVPGAGSSLLLSDLLCPARGGAGPVSVLPQAAHPAEGVHAWLLLPSRSRTHKENSAEQSDVLEEGEKSVRSKEKSSLPWQ